MPPGRLSGFATLAEIAVAAFADPRILKEGGER
jgi:hypothetical protein